MPLEKELLVASVFWVSFQWSSSGLPVVFQCVSIMQINTWSPLGHHWVLVSASVVQVVFQCTCGSSGLPVCSNYANFHWIAIGTPLGASISQCGSSDIPVYLCTCGSSGLPVWSAQWCPSVMTKSGLEVIRSGYAPACNPLCIQLVWRELFELNWFHLTCNPKYTTTMMVLISKSCSEWFWSTHICKEQNWYPLQSSTLQVKTEFAYRDLSTCWLVSRHLVISNWHGCYSA